MLAFVIGGGFAVLEGVMALREREHRRVWINFVVLAAAFVFNGGVDGRRRARRIIAADEHIAAIDRLRSLQLGPDDVLLVLHAPFSDGIGARQLPRISRGLEARLRREHPSIKHVVFDFD